MTEEGKANCSCECGHICYQVPAKPLLRMYCHCSICQKFNEAPYGDVFVYRSLDIQKPDAGLVEFDTYRPPPNVQRGKCISCSKPAIELLESPFLPNLVIVPGSMQIERDNLVAAKGHVFYESRVEDMDDGLPKYSGYLKSQLVFAKHLMSAFIARV